MVKFQNSLSEQLCSWRRSTGEGQPEDGEAGLGELSAPSTDRAVKRLWLTCLEVPVCALLVPVAPEN